MNLSVKFVFNLLLIISSYTSVSCRRRRHNHEKVCRDPKPSEFSRKQPTNLLYSFFQMPAVLNAVTFESVPAKFKRVNYFRIKGAKKCPAVTESFLLHNQDVCPVFYVLNIDKNRVPRSYIESVCLCNSPRNTAVGSSFDCKQQMIYAKVRRRTGCHNGVYVYSELWEPMRMGCTAKLNRVYIGIPTRNTRKSPKSPSGQSRPETPKSPQNPVESHKMDSPKSPRAISKQAQSPKSPENLEVPNRSDTPKAPRTRSGFAQSPKSPENPEVP